MTVSCSPLLFTGSSSYTTLHSFVHDQWSPAQREGAEGVSELFSHCGQVPHHREHEGLPHSQGPVQVTLYAQIRYSA